MSKRLEMLDKVIAAGSSDPFHHYARALELRTLGRSEEALAALQGVIEQFPNYVASYLMAGQLALELDQVDLARKVLTQGVDKALADGNEHAVSEIRQLLESIE